MKQLLPPDYQLPNIRDNDPIGYFRSRTEIYCGASVTNPKHPDIELVCTLPKGHWGNFHVAHSAGRVMAVSGVMPYMELPEGL